MNWEYLFDDDILERGYDYYCDGEVDDFEVTNNKIIATVRGSHIYKVNISLKLGKIKSMYCSCPYAAEGHNCKHMAAVLYTCKEFYDEDEYEKKSLNTKNDFEKNILNNYNAIKDISKKKETIKEIIAKADIDIVRDYLASVLIENEKLLLRFCNMIGANTAKEDVTRYKKQIDEISSKYLGRSHYIEYSEASDFIEELEEIYEIDVRCMIDKKRYMTAFTIINYIFELIGDVDMDDSAGGSEIIAKAAYDLWVELLSKVSEKEKDSMFQWFIKHLDGVMMDYLEDYVREILIEDFHEEKYMKQKLILTEDMIEKTKMKIQNWKNCYDLGDWVICHLMLLEEQKCSDDEIRNYCQKYLYNSYVKDYYISWCKEKGDFDAIMQLLDKTIAENKEDKKVIKDCIKQKKDIYLSLGNNVAYLEQLQKLVLEYDIGNFDSYKELKKQYSEEKWIEKREEIFQKLSSSKISMDEFYEEEKMYDKLLEIVMNSKELYTLEKYTQLLKPIYPEKLLQKYQRIVNQMALQTGSRQKYQELVKILRVMQGFRGGRQVVDEIVKNWNNLYRNRPAMMDELRKL